MDRRHFLQGAGLAIGAGLTFPALPTLLRESPAPGGLAVGAWADVRAQFPLDYSRIHMAMMLLASHPTPVREAIERHRRRFEADPAGYWEDNFETAEPEVLKAAAAYLEADPGEIALTDSTTQGLGTLYSGFRLDEGDEILTTTHDHYSTEKSLEFAARRNGAAVRRVSLYDDPAAVSVEQIVERLVGAIRPKTRLVAVTWVHSSTGVRLPIPAIADAIRELNGQRAAEDRIYLAVDGVHGFGIENVTMAEMGCDYFVAGTHKWLFGPRGTGIVWARRDAWDRVIPTIPSFSYDAYGAWLGILPEAGLTFSDHMSPGGFHAFDHRWALGEAFDFQRRIGKAKVERRTHELSTLLKEGLKEMPHVTLHTPVASELSSGINCFEVAGMTAGEVVERLHAKRIIASTTPYRESYARIAPCIINTEEEVEACVRAVGEMKPNQQ